MSNANEEIEMPEAVKSEVRGLIDIMHTMAKVRGPIAVATACANFLGHVIAALPPHAQEGGIEALVKDLRASVEVRNKDRSSEGL